jgi:catechol 2,3-dioxygenase-like lactoylglutathione lyase family enzyme
VDSPDGVIAFDLIGQVLGLYPIEALAKDIGLDAGDLGNGRMTLGHNVADADAVDALLETAVKAGAKLLKPGQKVFWGGYHGYFADPEGHIWEVAFNPFSPLSPTGAFRWNGYG